MKYLILTLCSMLVICSSWVYAKELVVSIETEESWDILAKRYKSEDLLPFRSVEEFKQELIKWNPHVKGSQPEVGDQIYIRPPHSPYLSFNYAPSLPKAPFFSRSFNLVASYAASYAQSTEQLNNGITVDYKLNSPATLSLMARSVIDSKNALSFSAYGSYTTASKVAGFSDSSVNPPLEMGGTLYHEFGRASWGGFKLYYGGDVERFSTLDDQEIANRKLDFVANHLAYATFGMSWYLQKTFLKLSGSYSLFGDNELDHPFSGHKAIFFIGRMASARLTYSGFIKVHQLENDYSKLSGMRIGLGLGYRFY